MKRFAIIYGSRDNELQKRTVEELTKILLEYTLEFPVCFACDEEQDLSDYRCIYVGTRENHEYLRQNSKVTLTCPEEYAISVQDDTVIDLLEGQL